MRLLLFILLVLGTGAEAALPPGTRYVMSHFRNDGGGGDERLYISLSPDGLNWTALHGGAPVYQPAGWQPFGNVVRDPAILYDHGFYWVAYTSGNYGKHGSFGLVKSTDLLHWSLVAEVSTLTPGATDPLTWSPTFFRDSDGSVHVFVNIRPNGGSSYSPVPGMRVHELHPLNADWTQWSVPVPVDLPSTNTNELWVWKEGTVYHGIFVDFTRGGSPYVHVTSSDPVVGWGNARVLGFNSQEGGFILKKPEGGYRLYSEQGNSSPALNYLVSDADAAFTNFTPQVAVQSTVRMRNGKAIAAPDGTTYADWSNQATGNPHGDNDADGRLNVTEFATGTDPTQSTVEAPLEIDGELVRYRRANGAASTLSVEVSADLQFWYAGPGVMEEVSTTLLTDGREEVAVRDVSGLAAPQRFYRLRTTLPAAESLAGTSAQSPPRAPRPAIKTTPKRLRAQRLIRQIDVERRESGRK